MILGEQFSKVKLPNNFHYACVDLTSETCGVSRRAAKLLTERERVLCEGKAVEAELVETQREVRDVCVCVCVRVCVCACVRVFIY